MIADDPSVAFARTVALWRGEVDGALAAIAAEIPGDSRVAGAMRYALGGGGKRIRPILCLAAMEVVGRPAGPATARVRVAAAIELVHTYSLIHDDLPCMDDDDLRRGRATAHRIFGTHAAVLAGCALIPLACRVLGDAAAEIERDGRRAVHELCEAAGANGMVGGQVLDLAGEHSAISHDEVRAIHRMKTGALFRASLRIGSLLAGAEDSTIDALGSFGDSLGLAFQITDDVLDETSASTVLGKTPGKDRDADKATFVTQLGVREARRAAEAETHTALAAIAGAGLESPLLEGLARFAVHRDR